MQVAVLGGGIAGMVAAWTLSRSGRAVTLCESSPRLGGQIWTIAEGGFLIEQGAEGFAAASEAVPALCEALGIDGDLIAQSTLRTLALRDGALSELAAGQAAELLGFRVPKSETGRGIRTLRGGMGSLIDALAGRCAPPVDIRTSTAATRIHRNRSRWIVELDHAPALECEALVVALPPRAAAAALAGIAGAATRDLDALPRHSNVSVTLAYRRPSVRHPLDATGFVRVDSGEAERRDAGLRACTFVTSKFPGRAPDDWCLLRAFFRPGGGTLDESDRVWRDRAHRLLAPTLGIDEEPAQAWVARWDESLPDHTPRSAERVQGAEAALRQLGPVAFVGASYRCCGIDGAVRSAREVATKLR